VRGWRTQAAVWWRCYTAGRTGGSSAVAGSTRVLVLVVVRVASALVHRRCSTAMSRASTSGATWE
ncbi:MAG: hypothetical protein ACRDRO_23680, partial [Pseudonocardiaceae bacterium]